MAASFWWTIEGQLDSVQTGATGIKYLYDAAGRLVLKRVNGVAQAVFLWQGDNLLAELDGTATVKRAEYSYYPGLDNLHAVVINGERLYAHADGLGNVIALTDEAQAVRRTYGYDDWGNSGGTSGTLALPDADRARWKGALWMGPELDLYYMRNRWYEPATGRFLSEDPKGLAGGSNPLVFAVNNPITNRDPNGLECEFQPVFKLDGDGKETEEVIGEKLVCKDITFGDLHKIQSFLGGDLGRNVANQLFQMLLNSPGGVTRGVIGGRFGFVRSLGSGPSSACSVYQGSVGSIFVRGICGRITTNTPTREVFTTAYCLADDYSNRLQNGGGSLSLGQDLEYLLPGHISCYNANNYTKGKFFRDFFNDRKPNPNSYVCIKYGYCRVGK